MRDIEKELERKKKELDLLRAPEEMEDRLREALKKTGRKTRLPVIAASVLITFMLLSYSFDAIAYYGKKFTGYDNITEGSLQELNEEGRGQEIGKTCTFSNNVSVTIDGIMFDENKLVAFYKVINPPGETDYNSPIMHLSGLNPMGYNFDSGHGYMENEQTILKVDHFESPLFYEKWMAFEIVFIINGRAEKKKIDFTLNRQRAMIRVLKKDMEATVTIGDCTISFDTITASTMSSVIDGTIKNLEDKEQPVPEKGNEGLLEGLEKPRIAFDLFADNDMVRRMGGSQGQSMDIRTFSLNFDAISENFSSLRIDNIRFERIKLIDKSVEISSETENIKVHEDLMLKKVETVDNTTLVTVSSKGIPVMGLFNGSTQLNGTNFEQLKYEPEQPSPVDRTFRFEGTGEKLKLEIKSIRYSEYTDEVVKIPIE